MKKNIFFSFLCSLLPFFLFGQNNIDELNTFKAVKFNVNIGISHTSSLGASSFGFTNTQSFVSPGIGIFWRKEHRYVELGISDWYFKSQKNEAGYTEKIAYTSIRVERGWRWGTSHKPLQFFLGYALQPTFQRYKLISNTSDFFPVEAYSIGFRGAFTPKLTYRFSQDWFIDMTLLAQVSDFDIQSITTLNPALTSEEQQEVGFNFVVVNWHTLNENIGLKLSVGKVF